MEGEVGRESGAHEAEELSTWQGRLEQWMVWVCAGQRPLNRAMVLAETESTQDAAMRLCDGTPGLVVLAGRQTKGRGRLGRLWADTSHLGVAMTFVLEGKAFDDARLSLAAGVAASKACGADIETYGGVRLRWPNDVVEDGPLRRKVAGVLIERSKGLAYVGIGVNVLQRDSDWPLELKDKAVSLRRLGKRVSRIEVPLGVARTWVKYVETGTYPDSRRHFQVTRCNHCANPPCVRICPVTAMYQRHDGIVEFDKDICIGCKASMQACPYDAIYIDPESHTAAKCHYCSHRTDIGLEPACVVVCPEHAIIAGDMDNPNTEISRLDRPLADR